MSHSHNIEQAINHSVISQLVPLSQLMPQQRSVLFESCELVNLVAGQSLVKIGDTQAFHLYLIYGGLDLEDISTDQQTIDHHHPEAKLPIAHEFPRSLNVTATEDTLVLKVPSDLLEKVLCWGQTAKCLLADVAKDAKYEEDYLWIQKLLESRLFYKVPSINILKVLNGFTEVKVSAKQKIIHQGDEGSCCYLIKSGSADVIVASQGIEPVAVLQAGTVFGEDALVNDKPRNATVIMREDGVLMKLEKQDFYSLLQTPDVEMLSAAATLDAIAGGAIPLDVRTQREFDTGHHQKAINIPLHLSLMKCELLDKSSKYITYANRLERAQTAAYLLGQQGFDVRAMQPGLDHLSISLLQKFKQVL